MSGAQAAEQTRPESRRGMRYLVGIVGANVLGNPETPIWISYDPGRKRFVATLAKPACRYRAQVGPYTSRVTLWQLEQDVSAALHGLRTKLWLVVG